MNKHLSVSDISFPSDDSLHQLFRREVKLNPDKTALVFQDKTMSYQELDNRSDQVASQLLELGIQPEDFVALYLERSFDIIIGIFGILKAGGAYVPIDVDYPKDRMAFMVADAQAKVILTQKHLKEYLPITEAKIICLDDQSPNCGLPTADCGLRTADCGLAYMIYTSGSTGKPKGVMISHENVCNQLEGQQAIAPEPIGAMMLTCSISFDVSVLTIFWTLLQGATLVIPEQGEEMDMTKLAETIFRNEVSHILTLPSLYTLLLEQAPSAKLQSLRLVNVSGEVCPVSLAQKHEQIVPNGQLYNLYGPTEATVNCTYFTFPKGYSEAKAPIGKPIKNYEIFILNENLEEVPKGGVGEIYIGGSKPVVGRGYWNRPELTAERFISPTPAQPKREGVCPFQSAGKECTTPPLEGVGGRLYKTGDLARWMPDGNIEFLGRSDFQVKYRGFRIELGEVETALSNHEAVKETVVLLKNEQEVNNQQLVAYLTVNQGFNVSVSSIREYLSASLPEYMLPSHFVFLEKMPLTTNGKFDRSALPEPSGDRPDLGTDYAAPISPLEKEITDVWEDLLSIAPIGRHDKFFELGGTSIQAAKFIGEMMRKLDTSIFITTIFDYPTVSKYAAFLEETYPDSIKKINAIIVSGAEGESESPLPLLRSNEELSKRLHPFPKGSGLTQKQIADFPKCAPVHLNEDSNQPVSPAGRQSTTSNQQPIFILAPPRSGTTLLRVMLAGHPELFACNELQLLHFETLADRAEAYTGKFTLWSEGLIRAVMELKNLTADEAKVLLFDFETQGMTTVEMFAQLQIWVGDRSIVDKSPSYLLDPLALEKAIYDFPNARFIHLVRHPYSTVKSFEKYHMDQVMYLKNHDYTAQELGELVWLQSHQNAINFLEKIPVRQQYCMAYEDLVSDPERVMQDMCYDLGLPFHPNLLNPYQDLGKKMTDGLYKDSRSMGDTHFDEKKKIDPKKAKDWKGVLEDNFLCETTWDLAERFGYEVVKRDSPHYKNSSLQDDKGAQNDQKERQTLGENNHPTIQPSNHSDIAIIGMACRFPGANNVEEFWQNLLNAKDVSRRVTDADLEGEGVLPSDNYVRKTYALDDPYCFDAPFFGYQPREAELTDPQHRIFLETAYEALESAGYDPFKYKGKIGVLGGVAKNTYFQKNVLTNPELLKAAGGYQEMISAESTFSISRVAYKLNLRGPAVNIQTACSTGGVAVHLACQSIMSGDSDMVIVGGGRVQSPVNSGYEYVEGGPLSPDGTLRAFDANANGMVQGNGMGMLVFKRFDQAQADGDHIWAVIKSSAINNDGSDKTGLTAPSGKGQAECIASAIEKAGLTGAQIGYFETHGTGTFIGDPIEIQGLTTAVNLNCNSHKIPIGSVKTNIGHLDAGACIAGIIKTALALKYEMLPPSMHFTKPNPQLNLEQTPFYVLDKMQPWLTGHEPRRAGVSSFGLGGTNAHIILEEADSFRQFGSSTVRQFDSSIVGQFGSWAVRQLGSSQLLLVSAKTDVALEQASERLTDFLKNNPDIIIADAAQTLAIGRPHFPKRKALIIENGKSPQLIAQPSSLGPHPHFVWMFPGGGAQYENMARDLYETNKFFKKQVNQCFEILTSKHGLEVGEILFPTTDPLKTQNSSLITQPSYALASLFTVEYSLAKLWQHWGLQPTEMIGHSMGEYTAACLSGVMTLEDALDLVTVRGKLFETLDSDGCMLSISASEEALKQLLDDDHTISVINKKDSLVVSSTKAGIDRLKARLDNKGIDSQMIHISVPAHSPLIDPILGKFREHLQTVDFQTPKIPFISNVTGTWITNEEATDPNYWIRHIRQTVKFADGVDTLLAVPSTVHRPPSTDSKRRIFLEVGPGQTLSSFVRAVPTLSPLPTSPRGGGETPSPLRRVGVGLVVASLRHPKEVVNDLAFIYKTVGKLWCSGLELQWENFYENENFQRVPLPTYPFEKKKYFVRPKVELMAAVTPHPPSRWEGDLAFSSSPMNGLVEATFSQTSSSIQSAAPMSPLEGDRGVTTPTNQFSETLDPIMKNESRIPNLIGEIQQSLHELSGMEPAVMNPQDTFLELGFDSLFLSQAVIKFNYKFKVKLSFRQLFEEAPTIAALAEWVDEEIPAEMFRPVPVVIPTTLPVAQVSDASKASDTLGFVVAPSVNASQLETLIQHQLAIMQQQLVLLRGGAVQDTQSPLPPLSQLPSTVSTPSATSTELPEESQITRSTKGVTAKMGNYKKISGGDDLTEKQKQSLEAFMQRYNAMTQRSKDLSQRHRQYYADPRSTTGFSKLWKEICYQIAHEKSKGSKIWDVDGNEYIDYVMSYGVALFGHIPDFVEEAVTAAIRKGNSIDLLPEQATEVARIICEITGYDRVTLANTGTEAVLGAVRAARTITGKDRIAVFDTDYHGMIDQFMVRGIHLKGKSKTLPASPGIPNCMVENTLTLDYDDPEVLQKLENEIADLAAVVIEPVQAQNPHWQHKELIVKIRQLTEKHGVALIFDEIINGFRMHQKGAQGWYGVEADISAYGKSISGGLPMSAIAGKAKYMDAFDGGVWSYGDESSPDGVITYFASTFIKNPISVAAGYAAIKEIERLGPALQNDLNEKTIRFAERIREIFLQTKAPLMIQSASSFFMLKYADGNPLSKLFNYFLRVRGVNVRERPCFISTAHTEADFEKTYKGFELAIADMFEAGLIEAYEGEDLNVIVRQFGSSSVRQFVSSPVRQFASQYPITIPLTEGQQEIFLSDEISPEASKAYNIATEIRLEAEVLDVERMKSALQSLVDRHEALRTVINEDGKTQTVLPEVEIEIPVVDLRSANSTSSAVSTRLEKLYTEEAEHLFDLQNGPLVRFKIVMLEEKTSLVFIHVHHVICDGWSLGILTRELGEMYGSASSLLNLQGLVNLATPKPISQYANEQADLQHSDLYKNNEVYWLDQFSDGVPVLNLPTDFHRPPLKTYPGAVEKISFEADFVKSLRKSAAKQGTTFYVFMLAAYQAYLSRITGQADFVIGVAAAGHNLPGNQNLVAHAIGLLPVRTKIGEGTSFKDYVKTVRGKVLDAFDHQQFTYGSLVKKLKIERSANRNTLVNAAFNLDSPLDDLFFGNMQASTKAIPRHYETFDTFINLKPAPQPAGGGESGVDFEWNFNTDLFRKETIQLRLQEFKQFLQSILEEAEAPIAQLRLLPDFESQQISAFGQGEKMDFPLHLCLHELFEKQVEKTPNNIAVKMTDGGQLTYQELNNKSNSIAHVLREKNVQPGDYVGLVIERSLDMIVSIYGILKAGAAYVPIDPRNPQDRIQFTLEDAGCEVVVVDKELPFFNGQMISPADCGLRTADCGLSTANSQLPAYIIYTSGSTGTPKGVVIRHENAVNTLFAINRMLEISGEGTVYSVSSQSFDMSIPDYFLTLMTGATLIVADENTKKDGFELRASLEHFQPTHMQATPTTWQILMLSGWQGGAGLVAVAGGEAFPKELASQMAACCKRVYNGYGPTETTIYATYQEVTEDHLSRCPGEHVAIGSPIANTEMFVLDKNGQHVPVGVPGELFIGGKGVSSGYLNRKELTKARFIHSPFTSQHSPLYKTGDLVRYLPTGEIEFLGRIDDQVKIRGYRIELGEIEATIQQHPQVEQAVVNIFKDASDSLQLACYIVWKKDQVVDNEVIKAFIKTKLPGYMVPVIFIEMGELPMNTSLKVDRNALPKPDLSMLSTAKKEAPTTKGEELLTNIWKDLLGVEEVSIQDDFFELGGHSLAAVQLMSRIKDATGKKLPLTTLFQHSTIKKLAGQLNGFNKPLQNGQSKNGHTTLEYSSLICIRKGGNKPPLYLVHGGGLHVLFYQNMVKYLSDDQPIYALQAKGLNEGEEALDCIEDMAAHYLREIKSQNPHGPYCLAGYSLGGLIAWEMASQLQAEGKEVPLLALFDAVAKYEWAGKGGNSGLKKKFKKLGYNMSLLLKDPAKTIEYKSSVLKMQFQHLKGKLSMAYRNNETNEIEEGYLPYGKEVYEKSLQAYEKYVLKPLQIHVDLFKAKEQMFYLHDPEHYGWDQFALHGLTIHQIEGNHLTLFDVPHGQQVAEALGQRLKEIKELVN